MGVIGGAVRETGASLATVFGDRNLRRLNLALAGSLIGDWAYMTAVTVWAYQAGGATAVGVWGTVRLALLAVTTPFAANLGDLLPRKLVMVGTDLSRAVLVLVAAAVLEWDGPDAAVYVLATLAAVVGAPFRPTQSALLPSLVDEPDQLTAANGVGSTLESLAFFVGPAIAGLLLATTDVAVVFVLNAATFVWSAVLVLGIRQHAAAQEQSEAAESEADPAESVEPAEPTEPTRGFVHESLAGFRVIWADHDLRLIVGLYAAQTVVAGASLVFGVSIAIDLIDLGPAGVGYLDSVLGVGALVGGLVAIALAPRRRLASDFGIGVLFWAIPLLLISVWPSAAAAFLAMFVIGIANPVVDVDASTLIQRIVPENVMARVFGALEGALISTMALGALVMPLLITTVGLRWGLTVLAVPIGVLVIAALPRLRRIDRTFAAPPGLPLLESIPLFQPLASPLLESLARQLVLVPVRAGQTVFAEGDQGDRFYLIESGRFEAVSGGRTLNSMGSGDCFGEIALLRDVPRTATIVATEDSVLQALERDDFLAAVTGSGELRTQAEALASRRLLTV